MKEPWFWRDDGPTARLAAATLAPAAALYDSVQRLKWARAKPARAPAPVICIGAATLGGVGKTPFALALCALLGPDSGACFLTRGYRGRTRGPLFIDRLADETGEAGPNAPEVSAADVGDETLLLARRAPVVVSRNRPAGARLAADKGAKLIIMDDGYQNPSLVKDCSILLVDAADPGEEARVFPAGPMREPIARAAARADIIVAIERPGAVDRAAQLFADRPVFRARQVVDNAPPPGPVVAFCGIARPHRFFNALAERRFTLKETIAFPDHHSFTEAEWSRLSALAAKTGARLITTEKDFVRLPPAWRVDVETLSVAMAIEAPDEMRAAVRAAVERRT